MKSVSKNLNSNISQQLFYLLVLVLFLRIDLVFENNTPTGGDMGAHIVAIDTFIKDFMPNLQITDGQMIGLVDILCTIFIFLFQQ